MIRLKLALRVHARSVMNYGGSDGVRDMNLLESAISRPFATFDGKDLYPTAIDKAAAVLESILINHPFVDGNKRTGFTLMLYVLDQENFEITATEDEIYRFIIEITEGKRDIIAITEWLKGNVKKNG